MSVRSKTVLRAISCGEQIANVTYNGSFRDLHFQVRRELRRSIHTFNSSRIGPITSNSGEPCVYFIRFSHDSEELVKVGYATDIQQRFRSLKKELPPYDGWVVRLLGKLHFGGPFNCQTAETLFVEGLREFHVKGEWFKLSELLQREIHDTCRRATPPNVREGDNDRFAHVMEMQ